MESVSKETYRSLFKFCRKLTLEYPKEGPRQRGLPFKVGYVPDDISIDRSEGDYFYLRGKYYWHYYEVLNRLRNELALEYLEDRDLKNLFWHFVCEIIAEYPTYRDVKKLRAKVAEFLSSMVKPIENYEVLVPILYLDAKDSEIKIGEAIVKKFDEETLKKWGVPKTLPRFAEIVNKTMAIIPEKGNNSGLVCERARRKTDFVIRVLQVSLSTSRFIHDVETLYRQGDLVIFRKTGAPTTLGAEWRRGHKPLKRDIGEKLEKNIKDFLKEISDILEEKLPSNLLERFIIAITWIGHAIEEENPNIKIIYLSTALESILTMPSDEMKGETLAYRMLLLNVNVDETFIHPAKVLWIYEMRSKVIHGATLAIASQSEYYTIKHVAIDTLLYSLKVIRRNGLKNQTEFIRVLETHKNGQKILDLLEKQGDEMSLKIKRCMERNLAKYSR